MAPSTGSATQATIGTATGHVPAEVPLRKTALKALQPDSRGRRGCWGEGLSKGGAAKAGENLRQDGDFGLLDLGFHLGHLSPSDSEPRGNNLVLLALARWNTEGPVLKY